MLSQYFMMPYGRPPVAPSVPVWGRLCLAAGVLVFAGLAIGAALGDLWFDEIWSVDLARHVRSPQAIVTDLHHDNNHLLNTLFLYCLGKRQHWFWYRTLSLLMGVGMVALLVRVALRRGFLDALTVVCLAGVAYPVVLYSSEARGYSTAMFFGVASFMSFQACWQRREWWRRLLFWVTTALGLLAHLSFIHVYAAILCWSCIQAAAETGPRRARIGELVRCHAFPLAVACALYFLHVRHMVYGAGSIHTIWSAVSSAAAMSLGLPEVGVPQGVGVAAVCAVVALGTLRLWKDGVTEWRFFPLVLLVAPAAVLAVFQPAHPQPRYFVVCMPFLYLLLGYWLASCFRRSARGKALYAVALLGFVAGHALRIAPLLTLGRGGYTEAVVFMAQHTKGQRVVVGSDHDFRNGMLLGFYWPRLVRSKRLVYVEQHRWDEQRPEWMITHSLDTSFEPHPEIWVDGLWTYELARSYRYAGDSGWNCFIYRRSRGRIPVREDPASRR